MRSLLSGVLGAAMLLAPLGCATAPPRDVEAATTVSSIRGPEFGFATEEKLREHYSKHGPEFGGISREQYLDRALRLRDAPVGGEILQIIRGDTVRTRFDRGKGDFIAFDRDLTIRTFFRPGDGERYFNRQATRPH